MTLSLRHMRLVQEVVREGTLTGAARRLYLTQSALSHQLADLERRAGAPVFTRIGKRMVLTEAGRRILHVADEIVRNLDRLEEDLESIAAGRTGQIRLTTQCHTAYHWLPAVVPQFNGSHPGVEFRIVPECSARPLDALMRGEIDIALTYEAADAEVCDAIPLFEDEQVLIVAPDHALASRAYVTADDFLDADLLVYTNDPKQSLIYQRVLIPNHIVPRRVSEVRITEAIVALVAAGVGVAAVTRWSVAPDIRAGRVKPIRITELGLRREWHAMMLKGAARPQYFRDFVDLLAHGPNWIFDERAQQKNKVHAGLKARA